MKLKTPHIMQSWFTKFCNVRRLYVVCLIGLIAIFTASPASSFERNFLQDDVLLQPSIQQTIADEGGDGGGDDGGDGNDIPDKVVDLGKVAWDEALNIFHDYVALGKGKPILNLSLLMLDLEGLFYIDLNPPVNLGQRLCEVMNITFLDLLGAITLDLAGIINWDAVVWVLATNPYSFIIFQLSLGTMPLEMGIAFTEISTSKEFFLKLGLSLAACL